jgi:hypothetical protein
LTSGHSTQGLHEIKVLSALPSALAGPPPASSAPCHDD